LFAITSNIFFKRNIAAQKPIKYFTLKSGRKFI
jgi:hypothetical protein